MRTDGVHAGQHRFDYAMGIHATVQSALINNNRRHGMGNVVEIAETLDACREVSFIDHACDGVDGLWFLHKEGKGSGQEQAVGLRLTTAARDLTTPQKNHGWCLGLCVVRRTHGRRV